MNATMITFNNHTENLKDNYNQAILGRNLQLLEHAFSRTTQVLLIRFDVRYPVDYVAPEDNSIFQRFIEDFRRYLDRQRYRPLYLWCRERNLSEHHHYHVYFLLDGGRLRFMPHLSKAEEIWCCKLGITFTKGLIHYCNPNGTMVRRNSLHEIDDAISILSYLAKNYTKSSTRGIRNWNSSQVRSSNTTILPVIEASGGRYISRS